MNHVTTAALAEAALVTYRSIRGGQAATDPSGKPSASLKVAGKPSQSPYAMPLPSEYTAVVIVFGALHFLEGPEPRVAGLIAWGLVLATFLNLWQPSSQSLTGLGAKKGSN